MNYHSNFFIIASNNAIISLPGFHLVHHFLILIKFYLAILKILYLNKSFLLI